MSEWLDLMVEEIDRKKRESEDAKNEALRRVRDNDEPQQPTPDKDTH